MLLICLGNTNKPLSSLYDKISLYWAQLAWDLYTFISFRCAKWVWYITEKLFILESIFFSCFFFVLFCFSKWCLCWNWQLPDLVGMTLFSTEQCLQRKVKVRCSWVIPEGPKVAVYSLKESCGMLPCSLGFDTWITSKRKFSVCLQSLHLFCNRGLANWHKS